MDNKKLIELVKDYKFLYDLSDRRYSDNQKRDAAWKEISKKLRVQEKDCKRSWALLRDSFRRAIKKKKEIKNEQANAICKQWKYEEEMAFLIPYIKERPPSSVVPLQDDYNDDSDLNLDGESSITSVDPPPDDMSSENKTISLNPSNPLIRPTKRCRTTSCKKPGDEILMKHTLDNRRNTNDIDLFFAGIAATVKGFPPRERVIAKAKVFQVISDMELDILNNQSTLGIQSPRSFYSNDSPGDRSYSPPPYVNVICEYNECKNVKTNGLSVMEEK